MSATYKKHGLHRYSSIDEEDIEWPRSQTTYSERAQTSSFYQYLMCWSILTTLLLLVTLPALGILGLMAFGDGYRRSGNEELELSVKAADWTPPSPVLYTIPHHGPKRPCGHSASEARALGCVFDVMNVAWMPWECYDQQLSHNFQKEVPFDFFYADSDGRPTSRRVPDEKTLSEMDVPCWTTREYHVLHCTFAWKMMHRAVERGWRIESSSTEYSHTEHCSNVLTNRTIPLDAVVTEVNIGYPSC